MTNDDYREDTGDRREIPEEVQDISTKELTANDYDVVPSDYQSDDDIEPQNDYVQEPPANFEPGRTRNDDSIDASSENLGGTRTGRDYSAGHEMSAATSVGKPDERGSYDENIELVENSLRDPEVRLRPGGYQGVGLQDFFVESGVLTEADVQEELGL